MKTSRQVQGDIYRLLRNSAIAQEITGNVYRDGMRPRNSTAEDVTVIYTTGTAEQIQDGVVTVHIYVPDIDPLDDGVMLEDSERVEELETLAQTWIDSLQDTGYHFRLMDAISTFAEPTIAQHIIVVRIRWRYGENSNY